MKSITILLKVIQDNSLSVFGKTRFNRKCNIPIKLRLYRYTTTRSIGLGEEFKDIKG